MRIPEDCRQAAFYFTESSHLVLIQCMLSETSNVSLLIQDVPLDAFSLTGKQVALNNDL